MKRRCCSMLIALLVIVSFGCSKQENEQSIQMNAVASIETQMPSSENKISKKIVLDDAFVMELVDKTEMEQKAMRDLNDYDFMITSSVIHAYFEEGNKLRVFVTTYYNHYELNSEYQSSSTIATDDRKVTSGGGISPSCITYVKNDYGEYVLEEFLPAKYGGDWAYSIHEYCVMPVSGIEIEGLADQIINAYRDNSELSELQLKRLKKYMLENELHGYSLIEYPNAEPIPLS